MAGRRFKRETRLTAVLDENNYIVDMHLKGEAGTHQLVTGTLVHVGKTKKSSFKLLTARKFSRWSSLGSKRKISPMAHWSRLK